MCGIAGIIGSTINPSDIRDKMTKMTSVISHRGPDDEGFYYGEGAALGFKRLSIIDLKTGHQPIFNEYNSLVIVFNGEIYNFQDLRQNLIDRGHTFSTSTDTETIIHMYEDYGEQCVEHFNGMFAFCIWDLKNRTAFFARDRLGIKPLYYSLVGDTLIFGSEAKSILATGLVRPKLSPDTLNNYLTYRFCPAPQTPFEGIHKLPPGHTLTVSSGKVSIRQYWRVRDFTKHKNTESSLKQELLGRLRKSVEMRLISDVPLGLFLSGGIDSSAILALMTEIASEPVKTFSIGFDFGEQYQEFEYANQIAKLFRTDHRTMIIGAGEFIREIPRIVWFLDETVADSATIPLYFISKLAKKFITVALSGEGSDEIFAGYSRLYLSDFKRHRIKRMLQYLPRFTRGDRAELLMKKCFPRLLDKFHFVRNPLEMDKIVSMGDYFTTKEKKALLNEELYTKIEDKDSYAVIQDLLDQYEGIDYLDRKLIADLVYWLPDNLLIKADRATMANGVELRVPFLDYEFVEFCFRIKDSFKIKNGQGKYILKKAFESILPYEIIYRPKMGFPVPLSQWFRSELKDVVYEILLGNRAKKRNIFNYAEIKAVLDAHVSGERNLSGHIWILFILEIWLRIFIDGENYQDIVLC